MISNTIVITTYNRYKHLEKCLIYCLAQTVHEKEIIIVDDCSTDETQEFVNQIIIKHPEIKYIRLAKNSGVSVARNTGIKNASGRFITIIDDDDFPDTTLLEESNKMLESNKIMATWVGQRKINAKTGETTELLPFDESEMPYDILNSLLLGKSRIVPSGASFKRELFDIVGYYNESIRSVIDVEFFARIVSVLRVEPVKHVLINVYYNHGNQISKPSLMRIDGYKEVIKLVEKNPKSSKKSISYLYYYTGRLCGLNHMTKSQFFLFLKSIKSNPFSPESYVRILKFTLKHNLYSSYFKRNV